MREVLKKFLIVVLSLFLLLVILVCSYIVYINNSYYRIEDDLSLEVIKDYFRKRYRVFYTDL